MSTYCYFTNSHIYYFKMSFRRIMPLVNSQNIRSMSTLSVRLNALKDGIDKDAIKKVLRISLKELGPPTPVEIVKAFKSTPKTNWKDLTVREAGLKTLVAVEVICWFFVGECIGKGTLIGYQV